MKRPGVKRLMVFSGSANEELAEEVAKLLNVELGGVEKSTFSNGEIYIRYTESVRGADCFVIQRHSDPINHNIMEQLIMIDALKRASAKRITAVMPFYGYARQDKKGRPREPISAKMMGDLFHSRRCGPYRCCRPAHWADPGFHRRPVRLLDRDASV